MSPWRDHPCMGIRRNRVWSYLKRQNPAGCRLYWQERSSDLNLEAVCFHCTLYNCANSYTYTLDKELILEDSSVYLNLLEGLWHGKQDIKKFRTISREYTGYIQSKAKVFFWKCSRSTIYDRKLLCCLLRANANQDVTHESTCQFPVGCQSSWRM